MTTNIITIDLTTLNTVSLKNLARDFKVKNWWKLNKAALLSELTAIQDQAKAEAEAKAPKKEKKTRKAPKTEEEVLNLVTVKELASEFGMKPAKARRILRSAFGLATTSDKTRWEWEKGSEELLRVRAILHDKTSAKEVK